MKRAKETADFVRKFDRFFDYCNVRCISEARKSDLALFTKSDDPRLKVHKLYNLAI